MSKSKVAKKPTAARIKPTNVTPSTPKPQAVPSEGEGKREYLPAKDLVRAHMEAWAADQTVHDLADTLGMSVASVQRRISALRKRQAEAGKKKLPLLRRKPGERASQLDLDELDQIVNEYEEVPEGEEEGEIEEPETDLPEEEEVEG